MSLVAMSLVQSAATANSPDADLADFRLDQTQGELEKMPRGPERDGRRRHRDRREATAPVRQRQREPRGTQTLDDLFGIQLVGDSGRFETGKLAAN